MKKRLISSLCALAMTLSMTAAPLGESGFSSTPINILHAEALEDESGSCGFNCTYYFAAATRTLTISGSGDMENFYSNAPWNYYREKIKSVVIENGVKSIGKNAFCDCTSFTSINIPDSVTIIGQNAFSNCDGLTTVILGNGVTSIGESAFYGCKSLTSITIPDSVTSIGGSAFYGCKSLTSITIPDSVTSIGGSAFYSCTNLTSVNLGNSVTIIGGSAFHRCTNLTSVNLGNSVTNIGSEAFDFCTCLTNINIPDSVASIGESAFIGCTSLSNINVGTNNVNYSSVDGVLYNKDKTELICCPGGKKSITILDSVTSIGDCAFYGCTGLTSLTIPDGVTSVGLCTFYGCSSLTNIAIPDSVTSIGSYAFESCTSLKSHSFVTERKEATCTSDGCITKTCAICGYKEVTVIPTKGHTFVDKTVAPTYDAQGYTEHTCSVCGYSYRDSFTPQKQRKSISGATISISGKQYVYTGKALKPSFTVKLNGVTLKSGTDYTTTFKSNTNCGKATVTVIGKGAYTGSKTANFIIKPAKVTANKLTSPKAKTIKLTWTKAKGGITGYEVQLATNKKFTKNKTTYELSKSSTTSKTISGLKKKTTYYVKVRAYKTVGKTRYYGAWSAVKSVKTK